MDNLHILPLPNNLHKLKMKKGLNIQTLIEYPILHSKPNATKKLCLAMAGFTNPTWLFHTNILTPAYGGSVADITEIWARVAEDYAPFDIDVTTEVYPEQNFTNAIVAIGGNYTDWYGGAAGGVSFVGGFYNFLPGVGYVFSNNLGNYPKYVAEAASHEAGHLFGLQHQALWNGNVLVNQYNQGDGTYAPIMGVGYYAPRTIWFKGPTSDSPNSIQDDFSILSRNLGLVPDEVASIEITNGIIDIQGLINSTIDEDISMFFTPGGSFTAKIEGVAVGSNLDPIIDVLNSDGILATGNEVTLELTAGQYFIKAKGNGVTGDMGQYTIKGTLVPYNVVTIKNGTELILNITGYDKKGNLSDFKTTPEWLGGEPVVSLSPSSNGHACKVTTKPNVVGSVVIMCQVDAHLDSIELIVTN